MCGAMGISSRLQGCTVPGPDWVLPGFLDPARFLLPGPDFEYYPARPGLKCYPARFLLPGPDLKKNVFFYFLLTLRGSKN